MKSIVESIKQDAINEAKGTWAFLGDVMGGREVKLPMNPNAEWLIIDPAKGSIIAITPDDLGNKVDDGDDADWEMISRKVEALKVGQTYEAKDEDGESLGFYIRIK